MIVSPALQPELAAVRDFLLGCSPFDELSESELAGALPDLEIHYYQRGHSFLGEEDMAGGLRIIRSGAVELRNRQNKLIDRFGESISFNLLSLSKAEPGIRATCIEDSLIYTLPEACYQQLRQKNRDFDRFFHSQRSRRLRRASRHEPYPSDMMRSTSELMEKNVLTAEPGQSIQEAAKAMSARKVSSIFVVEGENVRGIVTDRDIRSRVVAKGLSLSEPIETIMSARLQGITPDTTVFDALLFMTQHSYHHVPVMSDSKLLGIVTASDLMLAKQDDPVFMVQHIRRQNTVEGLKKIVGTLESLLVQWVDAGIRAYQVGHILTAVSDAVAARLIIMAEQQLGPAPAPYCWLGFGSQGRGEQLLGADQDNGLVISDEVKKEELPWFKSLADFVCNGLNECGYRFCPGDIMAKTDQWRQPLAGWQQLVDSWTRTPTADALMRVSIFFDLRCIHGDASLGKALQEHMLKQVKGNSIFFAALAENALDTAPPIGIFRRFVVERNGEHRDALNVKKRGLMPIIDCVRIHALANQLPEVNTIERLRALAKCKAMTINDSRNLEDAYRVIMQIRVNEQARQLMGGEAVSNYLKPERLSKLVKEQLRDAFSIVADAQAGLRQKFRQGLG